MQVTPVTSGHWLSAPHKLGYRFETMDLGAQGSRRQEAEGPKSEAAALLWAVLALCSGLLAQSRLFGLEGTID